MRRPPLDNQQTEAALNAYYANQEQAWRYVLAAVDPTAFDAPARPFLAVLQRVQELVAIEIGRYAEEPPADGGPAPDTQEEQAHG